MALSKVVEMPNGLPLGYHRVALVTVEPNQQVTILRHSYLDGAARQVEKDHAAGTLDGEPQFPYVDWEYVSVPYADAVEALRGGAMEGAYALLKAARPELADAEDC